MLWEIWDGAWRILVSLMLVGVATFAIVIPLTTYPIGLLLGLPLAAFCLSAAAYPFFSAK